MGGKSKKYIIGLGGFTGYKSGMPYCSEARAIFRYMTDEPNSTRKTALNRMVYGMIGDNLWVDDNDRLWMFAAHSGNGNTSLLDLLHPEIRGNDCTNVNSTTFGIDEGYTGDAISMFLDTNFNPYSDGVNYILNDASIGIYIRTNVMEVAVDIGNRDSVNIGSQIVSRYNDGKIHTAINMPAGENVVNADSRGFYIATRLNVNDNDLYRNKVKIIDGSAASVSITSKNIYILARNKDGTAEMFSTKQISAAFGGSGKTQTKAEKMTDWINGYMTEIGKNVF